MKQMPKVGDIISRTVYARVADVHRDTMNGIDLDLRESLRVTGKDFILSFSSAGEVNEEVSATQTFLAETLAAAAGHPFTVCFERKSGAERILIGCLVSHEDRMGRSMVRDFEVTEGSPLRLVDHRTLKWIILNGTRYTLNGKGTKNGKDQ